MILVGRTGAGKSTLGNRILGKNVFQVGDSVDPVTTSSVKKTAVIDGRKVSVIDTPGIFSVSMDEERVRNELKRSIDLSVPGPHVFLLVMQLGRFTGEDRSALEWIWRHFGEGASQYTILLFTGADQIRGRTLDEFLNQSGELQDLINQCGHRYHNFNDEDEENHAQVTELMQKIVDMMENNGGDFYNREMYKQAQRAEERRKRRAEGEELMGTFAEVAAIAGLFCALGVLIGGVIARM